jgi:hypothetical protein
MSRHFIGCVVLALAGMLALPDPSFAGPGGLRGGGPRAGIGMRAALLPRHARPLNVHQPRGILRQGAQIRPQPARPRVASGLARTTVRAPFARLERRHHRGYVWPYVYPSTTDDNGYGYIGTPYDPGEAIPVYSPPLIQDLAEPLPPPAPAPRLSSAREENGEACRAERVTVPAAEGEREITVIRC